MNDKKSSNPNQNWKELIDIIQDQSKTDPF